MQPSLNLLPTVQQAITNLLTVYEPEFLRFGYGLFLAFATIVIAWQGVRMMFSHDDLSEQMFDFAKLLLFVSFGYALITFYEAPLPGIGVSFSNLITDQAFHFQQVLEARAFDNIYRHLDELANHFMQPDAWSILANLMYWTVLLLVAVAKALALAVIAFGLIASAVCGLLGSAVFHRAQAGLALLGMAQVIHPVFLHSGCSTTSSSARAIGTSAFATLASSESRTPCKDTSMNHSGHHVFPLLGIPRRRQASSLRSDPSGAGGLDGALRAARGQATT